MTPTIERSLDIIRTIAGDITVTEHHGDVTAVVPVESLCDIIIELRDNQTTQLNYLSDITAIDWLKKKEPRFEVVYLLYSIPHKFRLRIKVALSHHKPHAPTITHIHEGANWYERETYDMYGIIFDGHPDLRRFYMPEDFVDKDGHPLYPLRKDFPLAGIPGSLPLPPKPEANGG